MSVIKAEILRTPEALEALAPEWEALFARAPRATPFQHPAWLLPWLRTFAPGEPCTVAVRRDGLLVGLAPFYREVGALGTRLLPVGISLSDYHDVILDTAHEAEAGQALVGALAGEGFDAWSLEELPPDAAAWGLPAPEGCGEARHRQSACPVLAFRDPASLAANLPKTKRRKIALARNRAARRGFAIEAADEGNATSLLDSLFSLHAQRWESRGEPGVLADPTVQRFHRSALPGLLRSGLLRLHAVRLGGERAAVYYGFGRGARAYAYLMGIDPAQGFESPGVLAMTHAMEAGLAGGVREFHFLRGQELYKYEWGAEDRWNALRLFSRAAADAA